MTVNLEEKINEYYALEPTKYSVLESIKLMYSENIDEQVSLGLLAILAPTGKSERKHRLRLEFFGVRSLVFAQPSWSQISIPHLELLNGETITGIENRGTYYVRDPSQDQILRFWCNDFVAKII